MAQEKDPQTVRTVASQILDNVNNLIGEGGVRTEVKITITTETMLKLLLTMVLAIMLSFMLISMVKKATATA